jgi:hypothetical protein
MAQPTPKSSAPRSNPAASTAAQLSTPPASPVDPATVVQAYYDAINAGDYAQAWRLGGDNLGGSYSTFAAGFNNTVSDQLEIMGESGDTVQVDITALNSDGSQQSYACAYTVNGSAIVGARIALVSGDGSSSGGGGGGSYPIVHPGAFCSPVDAVGITVDGTLMECTSKPPGSEARWRHE